MEFDFSSIVHCVACLPAKIREFLSDNNVEKFSVLPYITLSIFCALLKPIKELIEKTKNTSLLPHCLCYAYFNVAIITLMHLAFIIMSDEITPSTIFHVAIVGIILYITYFLFQIISKSLKDDIIDKLKNGEMPPRSDTA